MTLTLSPNIADPDRFYQVLIDSQRDMTDEEASMMNCKLILVLANQIGDIDVIRSALKAAGGKLD